MKNTDEMALDIRLAPETISVSVMEQTTEKAYCCWCWRKEAKALYRILPVRLQRYILGQASKSML